MLGSWLSKNRIRFQIHIKNVKKLDSTKNFNQQLVDCGLSRNVFVSSWPNQDQPNPRKTPSSATLAWGSVVSLDPTKLNFSKCRGAEPNFDKKSYTFCNLDFALETNGGWETTVLLKPGLFVRGHDLLVSTTGIVAFFSCFWGAHLEIMSAGQVPPNPPKTSSQSIWKVLHVVFVETR